MKFIYIKFVLTFILFYGGCSSISDRSSFSGNKNDTSFEVTTNLSGDTLDIKTIVRGKPNGQFRSYYDSGKLWNSSYYVDGRLEGESILYTEEGHVAERRIWKNSQLIEELVYWQAVPYTNNQQFYFLSDSGVYRVRNGKYVFDLSSSPPDGFIVETYENNQIIAYVYKNGKFELWPNPRIKK